MHMNPFGPDPTVQIPVVWCPQGGLTVLCLVPTTGFMQTVSLLWSRLKTTLFELSGWQMFVMFCWCIKCQVACVKSR